MEKVPTKSPQKIRGNAVNGEQEEKVVTKDTSEAQIVKTLNREVHSDRCCYK